MPSKAVIFDCDGVLVDSELIYVSVELEYLAGIGLRYERSEYQTRFSGLPGDSYEREVAKDFARLGKGDVPTGFHQAMMAECTARFQNELVEVAGAGTVINGLNVPVCVASSSRLERLHWKLKHTGLHHHFDPHIYSGEQVEHGKPAPDLFLLAPYKLGVEAADCVVIEDSVNGVLAGVAAGMEVLGLTAGGHASEELGLRLAAAGALEVCPSYDDLGLKLAAMGIA